MGTYNQLALLQHYLVKEKEDSEITLVQTVMETGKCVLLMYYDEFDTTIWKKKDEAIFEIIEELTADQVAEYGELLNNEDDYSDWELEEPGYSFEEGEDELLDEEGKL